MLLSVKTFFKKFANFSQEKKEDRKNSVIIELLKLIQHIINEWLNHVSYDIWFWYVNQLKVCMDLNKSSAILVYHKVFFMVSNENPKPKHSGFFVSQNLLLWLLHFLNMFVVFGAFDATVFYGQSIRLFRHQFRNSTYSRMKQCNEMLNWMM